jgi:tRNA-Thr(GGU) m(6)t(6)A37 methyltransferase TsaA
MTDMDPNVPLPVIGVVRSQYTQTERTPIQSSINRAEQATVEVAAEYADGLDGLAGFDYIWLITWLHRPHDRAPGPVPLRQIPFLLRAEQRAMGIFATRGPRRVNPIGLSLAALIEVTGRAITFAGVDLLDGTPVLDIKPYVTRFDRPPGEPRCGWLDEISIREGSTPGGLAE